MATQKNKNALAMPSSQEVLDAVLVLGRQLLVEEDESKMIQYFLQTIGELFPGRTLVVRLVDLEDNGEIRLYGDVDRLVPGIRKERLCISPKAVQKIQIHASVAANSFLQVSSKWISPFRGTSAGLSIPIALSKAFYGVLDVGYEIGQGASVQEEDESKLLVLVNQLASALCRQCLQRETKSLRDYQSRFIEHASVLILGVDRDWRVRACNKALCTLVGRDKMDFMGQDLRDHFPAVNRDALVELFAKGMSGDEVAVGRAPLIASDGRHVPIVWRVVAIRNRGTTQALVAIGQDQSALNDLQKQLIQSEKMASIGEIAAGVVHELNNPLTVIGVYSKFLIQEAQVRVREKKHSDHDIDSLEKLERIRSGAERIQTFAQELMQYAQPSQQARSRVSIASVLRQSLAFCEHLFDESGVQLEQSLPPTLPDVFVVPGQLEQVVINLVTNAVHASGNVGLVEVTGFVAADGNVVLAVKDAGTGISAEEQKKIFDPFFTTKSNGNGTGLGLSIVRNIVEANHGELSFSSTLGEGSEFRCVVPPYSQS